jgi:DNA transformation protein
MPPQPELQTLSNLGPKSQQMLQRAGISTLAQLRKLGAVRAYAQVKRCDARASLNLLWALAGVLSNRPWQDVARHDRLRLLLQLEAIEKGEDRRGGGSMPRDRVRRAGAAALLLAAVMSTGAFAQQPSLAGTWTWTRKSNACAEEYVFRDDGTLSTSSRDARTESTYLMAWAPETNGRYKLALTVVKDNGARDCSDVAEDRSGRRSVVYLLFGGSRQTMILCNSLDGADCVGPLRRNVR